MSAPAGPSKSPLSDHPTHLQQVQAQCLSRLPLTGQTRGVEHHENMVPPFKSGREAGAYIKQRSKKVKF